MSAPAEALAVLDAARERTLAMYGDLPDEPLSAWYAGWAATNDCVD